MKQGRYYVQRLTEQVYLVREFTSTNGEPAPDDPIIRSFAVSHDAYRYIDSLNEKQREFDAQNRLET